MSDNTLEIIGVLEDLKKKSRGQYVENVVEICKRDFAWSDEECNENIRIAVDDGKITEKIFVGKPSLRIVDDINVDFTDPVHAICTQTDDIADIADHSSCVSNE